MSATIRRGRAHDAFLIDCSGCGHEVEIPAVEASQARCPSCGIPICIHWPTVKGAVR